MEATYVCVGGLPILMRILCKVMFLMTLIMYLVPEVQQGRPNVPTYLPWTIKVHFRIA
jgi:hypothetical protein